MSLDRAIEAVTEALNVYYGTSGMRDDARIAVEAAAPYVQAEDAVRIEGNLLPRLRDAVQRAERAEALADKLAEALSVVYNQYCEGIAYMPADAALAEWEEARHES